MSRRLVIGSVGVALAAAAVALFVVAVGTAGTTDPEFTITGVPSQLTVGQQGLVFVRFRPQPGSGAATKTTIIFTFPKASLKDTTTPQADAGTGPDCGGPVDTGTAYTVTCTVGTVNPGQLVKRYVTFIAGATTDTTGIKAKVTFDNGSSSAQGGGHSDLPESFAALTIVDGTTADGTCGSNDGTSHAIGTAPVSTTVTQQTSLTFANAGFSIPCSWGVVGVINQRRGPDGAPQISSVGGPTFSSPATLKLTFASLPVPLSKFVLKENLNFNPADPTVGWTPVPPCQASPLPPIPDGSDTCLVGYTKGKVIVATLLYRGTNTDPWFN